MANVLKSSPTTVTVSTSLLQVTAGQMAANTFTAFEQPSLSARSPHPKSGLLCDVTEDGAAYLGHTAIDWAGKGCYDSIGRKVMWASCGAGNNSAGGAAYNTHAVYSEASNTWTAVRGFQAPGEGNTNPIGHMYDSNCIDSAGRRFYKKKFGAPEILVYDLNAAKWVDCLPSPGDEASYARDGGMDFIPTRGATGALWLISWRSGDNLPQLWECDLATKRWSVIGSGGSFGTSGGSNISLLSYNPRAFGGKGGALASTSDGAWTVRADTLQRSSAGTRPRSLLMPYDGHVCRDPVGQGWLYASDDGSLYQCDGSSWTRRAALPGRLGSNGNKTPFVMVPIDAYGVVWIIAAAGSGTRAWLYRA